MTGLADAIARDLLAERLPPPVAQTCFACGRPYFRGDGRFCGSKCRQAYDLGFTPSEFVSKLSDGVSLVCRGCGRQFVSKGLRCCSVACERQSHERDAKAALMAEVGMDLAAKRKCQECGGDIPRWTGVGRKRRQVTSAARFCSLKCGKRARRRLSGQTAEKGAEELQKSLCRSGSEEAPLPAPPSAGRAWRIIAGPVLVCAACGSAIGPVRQGLLLPRRPVDGGLRCAACSDVIPVCRKRAVPVPAEVAAA
jgi:hypothetical protein